MPRHRLIAMDAMSSNRRWHAAGLVQIGHCGSLPMRRIIDQNMRPGGQRLREGEDMAVSVSGLYRRRMVAEGSPTALSR